MNAFLKKLSCIFLVAMVSAMPSAAGGNGAFPEDPEYFGDPDVEYANIKVVSYYDSEPMDGMDDEYCMLMENSPVLLKYVDDKLEETMAVIGPFTQIFAEAPLYRFTVGVDTVDMDIRQPFAGVLDLRYMDAIHGCRKFGLAKRYVREGTGCSADFLIHLAMPDNTPLTIKDIISDKINCDMSMLLHDYWADESDTTLSMPSPRQRDWTPEQLADHYYTQFRALYDKFFNPYPGSDEELLFAPGFSFHLYAYPVWQNADSTLTTWKFYEYKYGGGAHGAMEEFFLTFDNVSGRLLGAADLIPEGCVKEATDTLRHQLNVFHGAHSEDDYWLEPDIEIYPDLTDAWSEILYEVIDGKMYPRPAMTSRGLVFSYQPYEKGSFADGILHFTQSVDW